MLQEMSQKRKMQEFGDMIQKVQQQNLLGQMMPQGTEGTGMPGQPLQNMVGQPVAQAGQDLYSTIASNPLLLAKAGELGYADVITKAAEAGARQQKLSFEKEKFAKKLGLAQEKTMSQRAFEENKPYVENLNKKREELPARQATLFSIRDVLAKSGGDLGKIRNWIASIFPGDSEWIKKSSANELASYVKENFVSELKGLPGGSKLNQLIEKNLLSALQSPGKTAESNQKITEFEQFKQDVIKKEIEIADRIRKKYIDAGKEPPRGLAAIVHKELKPYVIQKQKGLLNTYRNIDAGKLKSPQMLNMPFAKLEIEDNPPKAGFIWILNPEGKPVQAPEKELQKWLSGGGMLIK